MKFFKKILAITTPLLFVPMLAIALYKPFINGKITVTAATSTSRTAGPDIKVSSCTFQAPSTNAGAVYLGGVTVTNASGTNIGVSIAAGGSYSNANMDNLLWVYFAADNANDVVRYVCN